MDSPEADGFGGMKDQCRSYSAPWRIQPARTPFSISVKTLWDSGGGITSSASFEKIFLTNKLPSGSSGMIAAPPLRPASVAPSKVSSRNPAFGCPPGPWQEKHLPERMGRTSRLNWIGSSAESLKNGSAAATVPNFKTFGTLQNP